MLIGKIRKGWEFDLIFRTGIRINGELVRLLYLKTEERDIRVGFAVGKRLGKSHIRNRGRRILREAFRMASQRIVPGVSIILSLKEKGIEAKSNEIFQDIIKILERKKLLF